MKLKCNDCGVEYEKPDYFNDEVKGNTSLYFYCKRSMKYCDKCRRIREVEMLKSLPKVIESISKIDKTK